MKKWACTFLWISAILLAAIGRAAPGNYDGSVDLDGSGWSLPALVVVPVAVWALFWLCANVPIAWISMAILGIIAFLGVINHGGMMDALVMIISFLSAGWGYLNQETNFRKLRQHPERGAEAVHTSTPKLPSAHETSAFGTCMAVLLMGAVLAIVGCLLVLAIVTLINAGSMSFGVGLMIAISIWLFWILARRF